MHRPGGRGRRVRAVTPVAIAFVLAGCIGVRPAGDPAPSAPAPSAAPASPAPASPPPSAAPAPVASVAPTPTPGPTPRTYRVRPGDTLSGIAARLKRSVDQIITANPWIFDPDRLEAGQVLVVPERDAPSDGGPADQAIDGIDDLVDADGAPVEGDLLADLASLRVGVQGRDLLVLLDLGSVPPRRVTPEVERIAYAAVIDTDDDDAPDWRLTWATGADGRFAAGLEDLADGSVRDGARFPGSVTFEGTTLVWAVRQAALGGGLRYRVAASAERGDRAGGRRDTELVTIDRIPDQSWPLPNPRWYEIGIPGG